MYKDSADVRVKTRPARVKVEATVTLQIRGEYRSHSSKRPPAKGDKLMGDDGPTGFQGAIKRLFTSLDLHHTDHSTLVHSCQMVLFELVHSFFESRMTLQAKVAAWIFPTELPKDRIFEIRVR
jgi:hypothetical protein